MSDSQLLLDLAAGPRRLQAHASGALWLEDLRTLIVADLHLGYGFAQRRRGQLGPIVDEQTSDRLDAVLRALRPSSVVFLGDTVHAPDPAPEERAWIRERFDAWRADGAALTVVRGNHDRAIAADFEIDVVEEWRAPGIVGVHGDKEWPAPKSDEILVLGHLHPAVGIEDAAGVRRRVPVFLRHPSLVILPAFSPFAAGLDVWRRMPESLQHIEFEAIAATGTRVAFLGPLSRLVSPAKGSKARDFRRQRYPSKKRD